METNSSQTNIKSTSPVATPNPITTPPISVPTPTNPAASVVTVPIAVPIPSESTYVYIAVKASLYGEDCSIFGMNEVEYRAIATRFNYGTTPIHNGILIKSPALPVINALSQLGYEVVCSTGEAEIVWTMQREV